MGKTRRKEKTFNDFCEESDEVSNGSAFNNGKRPKNKSPRRLPLEEYEKDENYGSFEKIGKRRWVNILEEASEDRQLALESHRYFKDMVEQSENTDNDAKRLMVDCLKLAQSSKNNSIKTLSLMVKLEELGTQSQDSNAASVISFNDLESLADAKRW